MKEARFYLAGGIVAFGGLGALLLAGTSRAAVLLVLGGLATIGFGVWTAWRRSHRVRVEIEDDHLHPRPVLDEPKGTFDLITGMAVRVCNRLEEPVGIRIDTLLYERTRWKWDRPVSDARPVRLLASSVVPGKTSKSFIVKNYTRIPDSVDELTTSYFVKLLIETSDYGKSLHRVFLREHFELPKEIPLQPEPDESMVSEKAPLLPFSERLESARPPVRRRSLAERLRALRKRLGIHRAEEETGEFKIHRLHESTDSLDGLIDEINAELEKELQSGGRG